MTSEIDPTNNKDETLKKDFKIGQYVYITIYALLVISLVVFFGWDWMDLTTYVIGNLVLIALLYWVVKNKDN